MKAIKSVSTAQILPGILWRCLSRSLRPSLQGIWYSLREHGARSVENIDLSSILGVDRMAVAGLSLDRMVLVAASKRLAPKTAFEIGTYLGETTLALARNNPQLQLCTLDLPDPDSRKQTELEFTDDYLFVRWERGSAFRDAPEAARIQCLQGDSATFDFSPYAGKMDLIFVDASHSYSYVKADTEAALTMLSATGSIFWHDYPTYPGIFAYLNELADQQQFRIYHPLGTGLAFYTRCPEVLLA